MAGQELATADGYCLALGGSHAREGWVRGDAITGFQSERTQATPDLFFAWMADRLLHAHAGGAEWGVIGLPGPVEAKAETTFIGPFANLAGLKRAYDIQAELTKANPACTRLFGEGFRLIATNDGNLAAHAAATRFGEGYDRVGALINGTGIGFGAVIRSKARPDLFETLPLPLEIGHVPLAENDPSVTYETTISGTALGARASAPGKPVKAEDLPADHPLWEEVGKRQGHIAVLLSLLIGLELMVPTGGVGVGAAAKYRQYLDEYLMAIKTGDHATQQHFLPKIAYVPLQEAHTFELHGARSVLRSALAAAEA